MRTICCSLLLTIGLFAATGGADAEKQVMAAMDAYKNAQISGDTAALEKLLGDDLTYVHSAGMLQDKAAVIKSAKDGKSPFSASSFRIPRCGFMVTPRW